MLFDDSFRHQSGARSPHSKFAWSFLTRFCLTILVQVIL